MSKYPDLAYLTIEKNIPLSFNHRRRTKYPWWKLTEVNDSFLVPLMDRPPDLLRSHVASNARVNGLRITTHLEDNGIRVWCLGARNVTAKPIAQTGQLLPKNYDKSQVKIDFAMRLIRCDETILKLRPKEWCLFEHLLRRSGKIVGHDSIINLLWGEDLDGGPITVTNVIRVMIYRIRKRIPWAIDVRRGDGYIMHYDGPPLPPPINKHRSYWTSLEAAD